MRNIAHLERKSPQFLRHWSLPLTPCRGLASVIRRAEFSTDFWAAPRTWEPLRRFRQCEPYYLRLDQPGEIFVREPDQFAVRAGIERDFLVFGQGLLYEDRHAV